MTLSIIHRDDLHLGGFAGLKEHRLVMAPKVFGYHANPDASLGIGNLVYLADARFNSKGDTHMHDHMEVDVISVIVEGRLAHEGSLKHGQLLETNYVQVQRAGGEGFSHNEINPDDTKNRMIQMWVLPEKEGERAGYKLYKSEKGAVTPVYGGNADQSETFASNTLIEVAHLEKGEKVLLNGPFLAYLTRGKGSITGTEVKDGDLLKGESLDFTSEEEAQLIVIRTT
ncbi:MAG: pirin family protein [Proteobacteria bacterium]|nr:pirin family protein [Pseudomonadota bacterium]